MMAVRGSRWGWRLASSLIFLTVILIVFNQYAVEHAPPRNWWWSQRVLSENSNNADLERRVPSAFLIGAGKCGTGALMIFLNMHPSIVSKGGETMYFDQDYDKGYEWYRNQMPLSSPDQITIAKCAAYLFRPQTLERMYAFNSSMKLLLIIRDPVVRTTSWYAHKTLVLQRSNETIGSFEDRLLDQGTNEINQKAVPISTGRYSEYITLWLNKFPRNQLLVLDGDMLIKDPYVELHKVEQYLGIPSYFTREMFQYDEEKGFFCPVREDGNKKCLGDSKGRKHIELSEDMKTKLMDWFRPYNKKLKAVTGQTFSWVTKY